MESPWPVAAGGQEIVFFDVETTMPPRILLEFGAILVCPRRLIEVDSYSTLIRSSNLERVPVFRSNGITREIIAAAPSFREVASSIFNVLHGRVWAGHNIVKFDWAQVREAFAEIGQPPPEPKGTIDTLTLLTHRFGYRAENMKMATLANYFGLGQQTHRSLDDVRMNLEVLKFCSTVLFLESSLPNVLGAGPSRCVGFLEPDEVLVDCISAPHTTSDNGWHSVLLLHGDAPLQLRCLGLKVRFGVNTRWHSSRRKLNIVVDVPGILCEVLDACDSVAERSFLDSGSSCRWWPLMRNHDESNTPSVQLHIPPAANGDPDTCLVEVYEREPSGCIHELEDRRWDAEALEQLFAGGDIIDAYLCFDSYDYMNNAGIRLMAKRFVIHPPDDDSDEM